eukprot:1431122-Prymnesium_polylepis.1
MACRYGLWWPTSSYGLSVGCAVRRYPALRALCGASSTRSMVRRKAVLERYAALRCLWYEIGVVEMALAYGLWCAVRRYSDATRSCGASGT